MFRQISNDGPKAELAVAVRACAELAGDRPVTTNPLDYQPVSLRDDQMSDFYIEVKWYLWRNRHVAMDINNRAILQGYVEHMVKHSTNSLRVHVAGIQVKSFGTKSRVVSNTTIHATTA